MKAIVVQEYGEPEVMKIEEIDTPEPGDGQVLVKIHVAGVNPVDAYLRAGTYHFRSLQLKSGPLQNLLRLNLPNADPRGRFGSAVRGAAGIR